LLALAAATGLASRRLRPQCLTLRPAPAQSRRLNMRQGLCSRHGSSPLHENSPFCAGCREPNRGKALALGAQRLCALQNAGFLAADLRSTARPLLLRAPLSLRHACTHMVSALSSFTGPSSQRGPKPRVNPQWSLTPRSTPTRSGRQRKAGPRHMVHHHVPALRRLPTRAALPRTLGSTRPAVVRLAARIRTPCSVVPRRRLNVVSLVGARRDLTRTNRNKSRPFGPAR
jgi:hypothetical protein